MQSRHRWVLGTSHYLWAAPGPIDKSESSLSSLKKERIRKRIHKTLELARADVFDYMEVFYNRARRHSHLGGISPEAFESAAA